MDRLMKKFNKVVAAKIMKELNLKNIHEIPKLEKVTVNVGVGSLKETPKLIENIKTDLAKITGQTPSERKAKKSISGFKLKQGDIAGLCVTLRSHKMYDFIDKLINITLPRIRDFRGLNNKSFDQSGNISIGILEQIVFPEIKYENVEKIYSLEITITTNAKNSKNAQVLLRNLGFPFKKDQK